jgi:hypothetical protein
VFEGQSAELHHLAALRAGADLGAAPKWQHRLHEIKLQFVAVVGSLLFLVADRAVAATPPVCGAAVQVQAMRSLTSLEQRQQLEDEALRKHPTASYSTMNGPVLRELEKRKQREALVQQLQLEALRMDHCSLNVE